jgi:DNA topoisomerase VI subunit A
VLAYLNKQAQIKSQLRTRNKQEIESQEKQALIEKGDRKKQRDSSRVEHLKIITFLFLIKQISLRV